MRAPATTVGAAVGVTAATARRRISLLRQSGTLITRTEIARNVTHWPVSATFWATVDAHKLQRAAAVISSIPEVRMCAAVTGQNNLVFQMWLHSTTDVLRVESQISKALPDFRLVDRAIALEQFKLMGRPIDTTGHARGAAVPIDLWRAASS